MEILQPAKLVDDAKTDDSDSLLLAEHCKASSKAWEEEVEVGSGVYAPPILLVVGEQSEEEEDGGEKLCPPNRSGHCFCVNRVDSKEQSCNLGNLKGIHANEQKIQISKYFQPAGWYSAGRPHSRVG